MDKLYDGKTGLTADFSRIWSAKYQCSLGKRVLKEKKERFISLVIIIAEVPAQPKWGRPYDQRHFNHIPYIHSLSVRFMFVFRC